MQMMGGRKGGEDHASHDNSGGNEENGAQMSGIGNIWVRSKINGKERSDTLVVSEVLLLWMWLERRLDEEIRQENYVEAAALKREMGRVHDQVP
jgi:hypothetical protein